MINEFWGFKKSDHLSHIAEKDWIPFKTVIMMSSAHHLVWKIDQL